MTGTAQHGPHRAQRERETIDQLVDRLAASFQELDRATIERAVRGQYAVFDGSSVRDFVPVLVERRARAQLGEDGTSGHRADRRE